MSAKASSGTGKASKLAKKNEALKTIRLLSSSSIETKHLERTAHALIDPSSGPFRFPAPTPHKVGAAHYPLVVNVKNESGNLSDFGIQIKPSFTAPLAVTTNTIPVESSTVKVLGDYGPSSHDITAAAAGCILVAENLLGFTGIKMFSSDGATVVAEVTNFYASYVYKIEVWTYALGVWTKQATSSEVGAGRPSSVNISFNYPGGTETAYGFRTILQFGGGPIGAAPAAGVHTSFQYLIEANPGSLWTCAQDQATMKAHFPAWENFIPQTKFAKIVACDCLVTYEGSALANGGSIAVANVDGDFEITENWYDTIADLPFDKYRGRLASAGNTEGGGHWHYIPTNAAQLFEQSYDNSIDDRNSSMGVFGITGLQEGQNVKIEANFIINFYSQDPAFFMAIPPPFTGYSALLYALRKEVPLVSSNDSHLKKLKYIPKILKGGLDFGMKHDKEIMKVLNLLAGAIF